MGLTGGVKSHRLSGKISPYCEKKQSLALRALRAYVFWNSSARIWSIFKKDTRMDGVLAVLAACQNNLVS